MQRYSFETDGLTVRAIQYTAGNDLEYLGYHTSLPATRLSELALFVANLNRKAIALKQTLRPARFPYPDNPDGWAHAQEWHEPKDAPEFPWTLYREDQADEGAFADLDAEFARVLRSLDFQQNDPHEPEGWLG